MEFPKEFLVPVSSKSRYIKKNGKRYLVISGDDVVLDNDKTLREWTEEMAEKTGVPLVKTHTALMPG